MLKHGLLALMLAGLIYSVTPSAIAQDNGNEQQSAPAGGQRGRGHFDPAKRTEMLTNKLNLNSDQQAKVLDIYKSVQSKMEGLRSDSSLSREDRQSKMMEIHKDSDTQIRTLLNPDQQAKWDKMQSERGQWRGHNQDGQAPNTPPNSEQK